MTAQIEVTQQMFDALLATVERQRNEIERLREQAEVVRQVVDTLDQVAMRLEDTTTHD